MRYNHCMIRVDRLVWDEGNVAHITRHEVTQEEVEQVCHNNPAQLTGHSGRIMLIGLTNSGRSISVVLEPESGKETWYPVTARSADKKERRFYDSQKGVVL